MCRSDTTQRVLEAAKRRLLDAVPKLSPAQLISLLEASFAYVGEQSIFPYNQATTTCITLDYTGLPKLPWYMMSA